MMKVAVFGATGRTGRHVVSQALARGFEVNAFARNPAAMELKHDRLSVFQGDVMDPQAVERAVARCDAVVCALGVGPKGPPTLHEVGTRNIVETMKNQGVRRLVCLSGIGIGDSKAQAPLIIRIFTRLFLKQVAADKERQEEVVRASGLDWVLVRPTFLTKGAARQRWRVVGKGSSPSLSIPRADVAKFMLDQLTDDTYLGQAPIICGAR